jgi:hypothetical protein
MLRKTDVPGIYKEKDGVLINKDNTALNNYKKRKAKDLKINIMEEDMKELKNDILEIKELLQKVFNK